MTGHQCDRSACDEIEGVRRAHHGHPEDGEGDERREQVDLNLGWSFACTAAVAGGVAYAASATVDVAFVIFFITLFGFSAVAAHLPDLLIVRRVERETGGRIFFDAKRPKGRRVLCYPIDEPISGEDYGAYFEDRHVSR